MPDVQLLVEYWHYELLGLLILILLLNSIAIAGGAQFMSTSPATDSK